MKTLLWLLLTTLCFGDIAMMVMKKSKTHSDPYVDEYLCPKKGDIVCLRPPDNIKSSYPSTTPYYIVKVTGITKAQAAKYVESQYDAEGNTTFFRIYKVRVADVPLWVKQTLVADGTITLSWAQIKSYVRNKVTGLDET